MNMGELTIHVNGNYETDITLCAQKVEERVKTLVKDGFYVTVLVNNAGKGNFMLDYLQEKLKGYAIVSPSSQSKSLRKEDKKAEKDVNMFTYHKQTGDHLESLTGTVDDVIKAYHAIHSQEYATEAHANVMFDGRALAKGIYKHIIEIHHQQKGRENRLFLKGGEQTCQEN